MIANIYSSHWKRKLCKNSNTEAVIHCSTYQMAMWHNVFETFVLSLNIVKNGGKKCCNTFEGSGPLYSAFRSIMKHFTDVFHLKFDFHFKCILFLLLPASFAIYCCWISTRVDTIFRPLEILKYPSNRSYQETEMEHMKFKKKMVIFLRC